MTAIEKVKEYMDDLPVKLQIIEFEESTATSELAAKALGVEVGQIAKSLLFTGKDKSLLVVTSGDMKVNQKKLKEITGVKMKMADSDQVTEITGFPPGGVCPFALKSKIPVYLDISMDRFPVVYAAAGTPHSAVPITMEQLKLVTDGQICDLSQS